MRVMAWSCSRFMIRLHTVVLPLAVPPATPMRKGVARRRLCVHRVVHKKTGQRGG
jgi:hypothetical protein